MVQSYRWKWIQEPLHHSSVIKSMHKKFWSTHTGEAICVKGVFNVKVEVNREKAMLPLLVMEGNGPSLFGRD